MSEIVKTPGVWIDRDGWQLQATVWLNGEGIAFDMNEEKTFSLHIDELHNLFVVANALGFINFKTVKRDTAALKKTSKERRRNLKTIRRNMRQQNEFK